MSDSSFRRGPRPLTAGALGPAALLAVAAVLPSCARATSATSHAKPDALQLLEVDDDDDPFAGAAASLPKGVSILPEGLSVGSDQKAPRHMARMVRSDKEGLADARKRLVTWAESVAKPSGVRVLAGPVFEKDDKGKMAQIGWRTYLVRGTPIVDGADVTTAQAAHDSGGGWAVNVELRPEGAERLRTYTTAHLKHRMAIVVDGEVDSAPLIMSAIPSGKLTISLGAADANEQEREAKHLEGALLGKNP